MTDDAATLRSHLRHGTRLGNAVRAAGVDGQAGYELMRTVAEELFPGAYDTRRLTSDEVEQLTDETIRRLTRTGDLSPRQPGA